MADKILIIDDDPDSRNLLLAGTNKLHLECLCASDGREAFEILSREPIRLVLLDLILPVLDGIQILERIRLTYSKRDLPIIVISGVDDSEKIVESFDAGANDFMTKPVDLPVLEARIRNQLEADTIVGHATDTASAQDVDTSVFFVDGNAYDISFLYTQLTVHEEPVAPISAADKADILENVFRQCTGVMEKYGIQQWSRTADHCLYAGEDPDSAFLAAIEVRTLIAAYNMINDDTPVKISSSIGIAFGPTVYRDDVTKIFSEALNTSAHLVKHAESKEGIRLDDSVFEKLKPGAAVYFEKENHAQGACRRYQFP